MMPLLADLILYFHFAWVLFMILGFPLAWLIRSKGLRLFHMIGLVFYVFLGLMSWYCPLTYLEEGLRQATNSGFSYQGSFLAKWIESIIYLENGPMPLWIFHILAALYLVIIITSLQWGKKRFSDNKKNDEEK